jgi:hypothetical protein
MNEQVLREYMKFNEADLNANRNGRLSEKQQKTLAGSNVKIRIVGFGIGCLLFGVASLLPLIAIIVLIFTRQANHSSTGLEIFLFSIPWALLWAAAGGFAIRFTWVNSRPKTALKNVTGPIHLTVKERWTGRRNQFRHMVHELHIEQAVFEIKPEMAGILTEGDRFTIYFVENNDGSEKQILSME